MDPNDESLIERRPISPSHCLVIQQLSQVYFGLFSLRLNHKVRCSSPKSSDFSQLKPRNITKTYLSQIIKSKLRKLEAIKEKKVNYSCSRMQQNSAVLAPKFEYFSVNFINR